MGVRRRKQEGDRAAAQQRVMKRRRRPGPRRSINLILCADHATRLELAAVKGLTTPAEIVMDLIDSGLRRGRNGLVDPEAADSAA